MQAHLVQGSLPETDQTELFTTQSYCTINLQQKILQTYKLLTKISDWIANKL